MKLQQIDVMERMVRLGSAVKRAASATPKRSRRKAKALRVPVAAKHRAEFAERFGSAS